MDRQRLGPPPGVLERLRQLAGYTWDDFEESFHSSYDIWHVFGVKYTDLSTNSSPDNAQPRYDVSSRGGTYQDESLRSKNAGTARSNEMKVVAHISLHALQEERAYHIRKTLASEVDPKGDHFVRQLDIIRLASSLGGDGSITIGIFEYVGPNYLSKVIDYGPAWYNLHSNADNPHGLLNGNFVAEPMSLQTFLNFAIGAAQCIEILHGQQIVHGEIRGDAFHMDKETGTVRLLNLGAGLRTFYHGLTSTGWSAMSEEPGFMMKLSYMSPEQTGRMPLEPDSRTDIFSLGILFWTILLQRPAFEGKTPTDIIQAVLGHRLCLVSNARLDIPEVIGRIIEKATAKIAVNRYQSVSGVRHDLVAVRRLLGAGDSAQLVNWKIATRDVSPSFSLPDIMVGRAAEHDAIVKVIDLALKLRQAAQAQGERGVYRQSHISESHSASFDMTTSARNASLEDDHRSSSDGGMNTLSVVAHKANISKLRSSVESKLKSTDNGEIGSPDSDLSPSAMRASATTESLGITGSIYSDTGEPRSFADRNMVMHRAPTIGRCEVITIEGAAGLGKSRLIRSVQVEARQRGYFASSKFEPAKKTALGPVFGLVSSLFQQVFAESNSDPDFHRILKQHVTPVWPILHKALNLPAFLLDSQSPIQPVNRSDKVVQGHNNKRIGAHVRRREASSSSSGSSLYGKSLDAQVVQDFLRTGSSTRSPSLAKVILEMLRVFSRYKFTCLCLDDLHLADEESLDLISQIISARIGMVIILAYRPEDIESGKMRDFLQLVSSERGIPTISTRRVMLTMAAEERTSGNLGVTRVTLQPFTEGDVMEYVAATMQQPTDDIFPLGAVIQSKTAGNPFYVRQLLDTCQRKKYIWYDHRESKWLFDLDGVFGLFATETYETTLRDDIITNRLSELPTATKSIIAWGAMIGPSFSFQLVQRLIKSDIGAPDNEERTLNPLSHTEQYLIEGLQVAVQTRIIVPTQDDDYFCFAHDRYIQAATSLLNLDGNLMQFVMAQVLLEYYSHDNKYHGIAASSTHASVKIIKSSVAQRQPFRKVLLSWAHKVCENGARSEASKFFASCVALLQDDMWNNDADDVDYEETLQVYTEAAECYIYTGKYQDAMALLGSIFSNAKSAVDKVPSWILQSRLFAQEGDSSSAFRALKKCLVALGIKVDDNPTFAQCDTKFKRLSQEIQSANTEFLVRKPMLEDSNLAAVGAVLVEATSAAFWSDTLTFYQMTLIMVDTYLSSGGFPQAGMGFLHLALVAITRHNMIDFASDCGNIALALIERWEDPLTAGRGGTIYSTFIAHIQKPLQASLSQLEGALDSAMRAGNRLLTILNFGLVANLKFFVSQDLKEIETFCTYGCQDIPNWHMDTPGGTMIITIRQVCRALQGKTDTTTPLGVMSDEQHNSPKYKSWLQSTVNNSDRPLMLYESIEIAPLFLYGHYAAAVALGNSCLKKIGAIWSARNTRFLMLFHALSLAGSLWVRVQEQLDPVYRSNSPQLSLDIDGRSFEAGLREEIAGLAMLMKYFKRRIEQWQAVTDVNYLAWSKILAAQIAEMEDDHAGALRLYEEVLTHASKHNFIFEEALASYLLGGHFLRIGSRRMAKAAFREAIDLYRQFGATGVATHIEKEHRHILQESRINLLAVDIGVQTEPEEHLGDMQSRAFWNGKAQITEPFVENTGDRISKWQHNSAVVDASAGPAIHMLDLASIVESSQVISSVLQVDELLKTMCQIILQNCQGLATLAAIIIDQDQPIGWAVAASGNSGGSEAHNPPVPLGEFGIVADNVVNYCRLFRETVFLPDLMQDERFSNVSETWVAQNPASKSVVALPICHGSDAKGLIGVLYIEGQCNAFTNRNREVLQLLVNQIGISYSNALTLKEIERVSAVNKSMVDVQKKALSDALSAEQIANIAKAEALRNAQIAEEAATAKTTFLANISHELRTPLNGVIGNSELLLESQLRADQAEMADSIRVSADLLLILINDILDFSKIEAHKMTLHLTAFDANEMVRELVRSIPIDTRHKKNSKGIHIVENIQLPESSVYGDPLRLRQILGNLVSNSLKFTEAGSVTVGAKTEWETEAAAHLTFWVKDTGIGIPSHQVHKLFKPFSQADASTSRKYGGSGLGLSICKSLVESMGGTIKLETEAAVGTTVSFSITLPKAKLKVSADNIQAEHYSSYTIAEAHANTEYTKLSAVPHSQLRVCIAEDNPINRRIAVQFLQKLNFKEIDAYENGLAAVEGIVRKAKEGLPYHIVLMDVQMPVMDGYEATKLLREDSLDTVRNILVIALTASAVRGDREKCLAAGMNDYLAKPVRLAVLKEKIGQYIEGK